MKVKLIIEISGVMKDHEGEALDWIGDEIEESICDRETWFADPSIFLRVLKVEELDG